MRRPLLTVVALVLVMALPGPAQAGVLAAQDAAAEPAPAAPEQASEPAALPLADIPTQAQVTETRLQEIGQILAQQRSMGSVISEFRATREEISALIEFHARPSPEPPTRRSLLDLRSEWARQLAQMAQWRKVAGDRAIALSSAQLELAHQDAVWRLTQAALAKNGLPAGIRELVDGLIVRIEQDTAELSAQLAGVLQVQSQIVQTVAALQQADDLASEQLAAERRNLFRIEAPPIWQLMDSLRAAPGLGATLRAGLERIQGSLRAFLDGYRLPIVFHLASTLGILLAVYWFRGKLEKHLREDTAVEARRVLDHPVAGALLVILLATLVLYPRAPLSIYDLALLATVPVLLPFLPAFLQPQLVRPAVAVAMLFAIQRFGVLFLGGSPYQRPGILLTALAGATGLMWLLRSGGELARFGDRRIGGIARVGAGAAGLIFVVAVICNVVGNVTLAQFLVSGTLISSYVLLLMLTAVRVTDGMLIVFTLSRMASVSRFVNQRKAELVRSGIRLLHFAGIAGWFLITLWVFDLGEAAFAFGRRVLGASLTLGELNLSLGAVVVFLVTVWVSLLLGRALSGLLEVDVLSRVDLPRGLAGVIGRLTRYALISLGFLFALAAIGVQLTQLTIIGGALGVGIGFGLQNIVSNFVSGLILAFERPIREGDIIQLDALNGQVRRIGFRASIIRTFEGAEVIVPNASLITKEVTNWTLSDQQRRLAVNVGVAYGTDPARVLELLLAVAVRHKDVLKAPAPMALFVGFGDSSLNFELRFWVNDADLVVPVKSDVTAAVNNALAAASIEIPFPQRDIHVRSVDEPAAERLRQAPSGADGAGR